MEKDQNSNEQSSREPWRYKHPVVKEAAQSDKHLQAYYDALSRLEERLTEVPDDIHRQAMYHGLIDALETECKEQFPELVRPEQPNHQPG